MKRHLLPLTVRLYRNPWLRAIRYAFFTMMPFLLAISLAGVFSWVVLDPWGPVMGERGLNLGAWMTGGLYGEAYRQSAFVKYIISFQKTMEMGFVVIPMLLTMAFAERFAEVWGIDKKMSMFTALSSLVILLMMEYGTEAGPLDVLRPLGILSVMMVALISTAILAQTLRIPKIRIYRLKALPRKLSHYLTLAFPIILALFLFGMLSMGYALWQQIYQITAQDWLQHVLQVPLAEFFQRMDAAMAFQFFSWMPWWFGIHGQSVTHLVNVAAYMPAQMSNQLGDTEYIFCSPFFEAGFLHVMALSIAVIVFSKHEDWRDVSKFSFPMLCFNLQEPLLFGMPVVLNAVFLLPFVLAPIANALIGWIAISWDIVPIFKYAIPMGMPPFFSGMMSTGSVMGGILQLVWLITDIFIYAPFVIVSNMAEPEELVPKEDEDQ